MIKSIWNHWCDGWAMFWGYARSASNPVTQIAEWLHPAPNGGSGQQAVDWNESWKPTQLEINQGWANMSQFAHSRAEWAAKLRRFFPADDLNWVQEVHFCPPISDRKGTLNIKTGEVTYEE